MTPQPGDLEGDREPWSFPRSWARVDTAVVVSIALVWTLVGWIVGLHGEFPLSDDFSYALSSGWLAEEGVIHRTPWTYVPAVPHIAVGGLVTAWFGFSFVVLRAVGFVLTGLCIVLTHVLARQLGASPRMAAIAALAFGLNPLTVYLGFTFMTESTFLVFVLAGSIAGIERLRGGGLLALALAAIFSALAVATRDPGLALPIAFWIAAVVRAPKTAGAWLLGALPLAASLLAQAAIKVWIRSPGESNVGVDTIVYLAQSDHLLYAVLYNLLGVFSYLGFFLLPLALLTLGRRDLPPRPVWLAAAASAIVALGYFLTDVRGLPFVNLIRDLGLGPVGVPGEGNMPSLGPPYFLVMSAIGAVAGVVVAVGFVWRQGLPTLRDPARLFLLLFAAVFLGPHLMRIPLFDRYLIIVCPALFATLLAAAPRMRRDRWRIATAAILLGGLSAFAIAGTRDMLERHRAIDEMVMRGGHGIDPGQIRAGFAHRGYYHYTLGPPDPAHPNFWMPWAVAEVHYGAADGALDRIVVQRWMPPGPETFSLVARPDDGGADAHGER